MARSFLYLAFAAFFAFSIGLNFGLLGFHSFHFEREHYPPLSTSSTFYSPIIASNSSHSALWKQKKPPQRRPSFEVPGDLVPAHEVAVRRGSFSPFFSSSSNEKDQQQKSGKGTVSDKGDIELASSSSSISLSTNGGKGPISSFIREGGEIPIVLITCNRLTLLEQTIQSLLEVRGITKDIVVVQDGTMKGIADTAKAKGLQVVQNRETKQMLRGRDGASRIATHYKFALSTIFDIRPDAPAAIIIEDDLLFSPDFYEYFLNVAPIVEEDSTVFAISAWNDNGFKGKVKDPYALRRTEFFPGLGWLLSRDLYKNELERKWPKTHWDHWLRSPETHKGREIVYPEVPRSYHNGVKGTFMNLDTHNRYFRDIAYNQDPLISWRDSKLRGAVYEQVISVNYEKRILKLIESCHHVRNVDDFLKNRANLYCIWFKEDPDPRFVTPPFQPISKVFGIWHEHKRGVHKGLHEFYWSQGKDDRTDRSYFLLLNTFDARNSYEAQRPANAPLLSPLHFKALLPHLRGS